MIRSTKVLAGFATVFVACTGLIGDGSGGTTQNGANVPSTITTAADARIRRLTSREYDNTVLDIFGDTSNVADGFPVDPTDTGFDNDFANKSVADLVLQHVQESAETVAAGVVTRLAKLLPCSANTPLDETTCAGTFVDTYGKKTFRRPLTTDERTRLVGVFKAARALTDFPTAIRTITEALLQSPNFLYRTELGSGGGKILRLTGYEVATELSYFLTVSTPDDTLMHAAESGSLETASGIVEQVTRLLKDDRAKRSTQAFFAQWLDIDDPASVGKDPTLFPTYNTTVANSMVGETAAFVTDVIFNGDSSLTTLLTSSKSFANRDVAAIYQLSGVTGTTFVPVTLDPTERAGFITHPSVIAAHTPAGDTSPVHSGKFIREKLFCQTLPPPPANVPVLHPPDPTLSTRDRFAQHETDPSCAGCHNMMDPIGFGFEQFDSIGTWRTMDGKFPLTGIGNLANTDIDGAFTGPVELAKKLATSDDVKQCFTQTTFSYALGRVVAPGTSDDGPLKAAQDQFAANNANVKQLLAAIASSDLFVYRNGVTSGGKP